MNDDVRRRAKSNEQTRQRRLGAASISMRIPDDIHRRATECARELEVSLSAFMIAALEVAVEGGAKR